MKRNTLSVAAIAVLIVCISGAVAAWSQTATPAEPAGESSAPEKFQSQTYMLFGNPDVAGGEAEITVNPRDPENILVGILAGHNRLADGKLPDGLPSTRDQRLGQPKWAYSVLAVTHNGGQTWRYSEDGLRDKYGLCNCFDPFLAAAPDGTLYWGCLPEVSIDHSDWKNGSIPAGGPVSMRGGSYIMSSTDEGWTWSQPTEMMGSDSAARWPNGAKDMVWALSSPWDRAIVRLDNSTGTLYATGHGRGGNPVHEEDSVTASHDKGKTWGPIYNWDSGGAEYPQSKSGSIGAGNGLLAVAYIASKAPGAKCPCVVFATSKDDGKTFEDRVVADADPVAVGGQSHGLPVLAVDQSRRGRYAILLANRDETQLLVYLTDDYGKTWSKPVVAAQAPAGTKLNTTGHALGNHAGPAMKYSDSGQLGILWRAYYPDNSFDVWSSVSLDGGTQFKPVRVSHYTSPPVSRERGHFLVGDDYWDLAFDHDRVHFVWTDSVPGFLATWYGRVPLSAYGSSK